MSVVRVGAVISVVLVSSAVYAQTTADQIEGRFNTPLAPLSQPGTTIPAFDPLSPPAAAASIRFHLGAVDVVGATVLSAKDINAIYASRIGTDISVADLFGIANQITAAYGNAGYPLSRAIVPAQQIGSHGAVRIQVVEGFIDKVQIDGNGGDNPLIRSHAAAIEADRPISNATLERYLLLSDDLPGVSARSVLRRSPDTPGATTVVLDVEKSKPLHYSLTLDNRGSEAVGPFQLDMGATFENLLQPNSETSLRLINASLSQELLYVTAQHSVVLNGEGTKLTFGLKASNSVPGTDPLTAIDLKTDARTATVELSHPFIRSRNLNLQGLLGFEARDSKTYTLGVPLSLDRTRILRFGLDFDNTDAKGGTNTISAELSHGLLGLGANPTGDPLNSRQFGRADFTKLTLDLSRTQDLGALSPKFANWSVNGKITAQMTGDPLLSSEECAIGGAQYGRAFDSSTLSGDRCAAAGLEMRYQMQKTGPLSSLQLFGFYDIGGVSNLDPGSPAGTQHLASTGLGARFGFGKGYSGSIEIDKQLKNSGGGIVDTNPRIFISMKGEF